MELSHEHFRAYTYVEWSRGKGAAEILQQLSEANLEAVPSKSSVYLWCKQFSEGSRDCIDDKPRSGRPSSHSNDENIEIVRNVVEENPKQGIRTIMAQTGFSKWFVNKVLVDDLGMKKLCSVWIPHILTERTKRMRVECTRLNDLLTQWVTQDESWVLFDTSQNKQENMSWLRPEEQRPRVVKKNLTNQKTLLVFAFSGDGKVHIEALEPNETLTSERYVDFVHKTGELWRKLRTTPTKL